MHTQSNGTLRWFAVLGALAGMFLYKKTVSPFFVKWVSAGLGFVFRMIGRVLGVIGRPFRFVAKKGEHAVTSFVKKRLTAFLKLLKMILCKQ